MPNRFLLTGLLFSLLFTASIQAKEPQLTPEHILRQELSLNQLIVNIHLLQLDFQNTDAKEQLQVQLTLLDNEIIVLPERSNDKETSELLAASLSLWPVISHHTSWMAKLPSHSKAPEASTLLLALAKLDRKLLLLRQKMLTDFPVRNDSLKFLEQALLMQRLTREYISLSLSERNNDRSASGRVQLKTLADHFDSKLGKLEKQFGGHAHAAEYIKKTKATWTFIKQGIYQFPLTPVPELVAHYNNLIVNQLTSIHQMF